MQIDSIGSGRESIRIDSNRINMPALQEAHFTPEIDVNYFQLAGYTMAECRKKGTARKAQEKWARKKGHRKYGYSKKGHK